jgi:pyruvate/2-oxoglutarate dehydrogenase complex dihydrolipoamide dehydrogenase (E3) component
LDGNRVHVVLKKAK